MPEWTPEASPALSHYGSGYDARGVRRLRRPDRSRPGDRATTSEENDGTPVTTPIGLRGYLLLPTHEGLVMAALMPYLLVGVGGFIGANARFLVARFVGALFDTRFPLGTFLINVSGSFLLGVLGAAVAQRVVPGSEAMRLALGVGFLGAFTTFSTFEFETHALFEDGSWLLATTNMAASLFLGLLAVQAGIVVAKTCLR